MAQAQCFLAAAVVLLLVHALVRPYKDKRLDRLSVAAAFGLSLVAVINVVSARAVACGLTLTLGACTYMVSEHA